jgi:hypothetical protein
MVVVAPMVAYALTGRQWILDGLVFLAFLAIAAQFAGFTLSKDPLGREPVSVALVEDGLLVRSPAGVRTIGWRDIARMAEPDGLIVVGLRKEPPLIIPKRIFASPAAAAAFAAKILHAASGARLTPVRP